ncbi:hypothetical protein DYQ11_19740 [Escherichia coli]|nr:hypothetical protein [Escherichia coli]
MPPRIPRACRKRGCAGTTTDSSGYCDKHRGEGWVSVAERARRNLEADVELFIDVLCDTGLQPVFSEDDREQVIAVYGPVHARLLRQSLELISDAGEVKKK